MIAYLTSDEGKAELKGIGGVSAATAGVILRALVNLEAGGGDTFFGDPEFDPADLLRVDQGRGVVTAVELADQSDQPGLFSTFLMWILAELFQRLPEKGDVEQPELVFVFDEAHLLFTDASKAFLQQVEQTVKLIRSKGVGVYFCSQQPTDIPGPVLSQLGARVQHALRAFTPDDEKALSKTVRTYPKSEYYDIAEALTSLGTGEALVTVLSERGAPTPVAWTLLRPPHSFMGTVGVDRIRELAGASPISDRYARTVDPLSAFEKLQQQAAATTAGAAEPQPMPETASPQSTPRAPEPVDGGPSFVDKALGNPAVRSFLRSAASSAGREISRSLFGTRRRR